MLSKKLLIITYYWPPSGGAGVQRWLKFATNLDHFGWEVHVLTVDEKKASYPYIDQTLSSEIPKSIQVHKTATWEPYKAYQWLTRSKSPAAGFANVESSSQKSFLQSISLYIRGNLFIPDPRRGWNRYAIKKATQLLDKWDFEAVITTSPPHSSQLIGLALKNTRNIFWIADLRDPWTDIYYYKHLKHSDKSAMKDAKYEQLVLEKTDRIITVSESLSKLLKTKLEAHAHSKFRVITNGFDALDFQNLPAAISPKFTIGYMGTITNQYRLDSFLEAISHFRNIIELTFVGELPQEVKRTIEDFEIKITHVGCLSHRDALIHMSKCSAYLLSIPQVSQNAGIVTGKLFEYLALTKPIIGVGPTQGDAAQIVDRMQAGKFFDYNDVNGITKYVDFLLKTNPIPKNKDLITEFTRIQLTRQLESLISEKRD
jgi:glycosyltransferase involved in cell wall biosynthesis